MADPKIKIKRGTGKPSNWNGVSGATAGELYVDFTNTSFYIGNTFGQAITFSNLIDPDPNLTSNSDLRIPTQKAVKSYAEANLSSSGGSPDLFMIRQIAPSDSNALYTIDDEENSNSVSRGTSATIAEIDNRFTEFFFDINKGYGSNPPPHILRTRSDSIFKSGNEFSSQLDSAKIIQTSGSSIKAFVSYQISFDLIGNDFADLAGQTVRRAAIRVTTFLGGNPIIKYFLPNYIVPGDSTASTSLFPYGNANLYVVSSSGIIDFPHIGDGSLSDGTGYIELVWGISNCNLNLVEPPFFNNYRYAGRSTIPDVTKQHYPYGHINNTFASIDIGYATRLSVIRI
jgi:hypothetical protein